MNNYRNLTSDLISRKQLAKLNLFWWGFIIYTIGYCLSATWVYISYTVCQGIQLIGLAMIVPISFDLIKFRFDNKYLKTLFTIYMLWLIGVVARGFQPNTTFVKQLIFDVPFGIGTYLAPLILLFPRNLAFYKKLINVTIVLGISSLIYNAIFVQDLLNSDRKSLLSLNILETSGGMLSITTGFLLLTYIYHSNKRVLFSVGCMVVTILFAIFRARRSLLFMLGTTMMFYLLIYLITTKKKMLIIYFSILMGIVTAFYIGSMYKQSNSGMFGFLMARADEDTRSGVEQFMYDDMTTKDWVVGKGLTGSYWCPNIDVNDVTGFRSVIETGYLQIMLKGGAVSLVLILLIAFPALVKGIFYSKNVLSKAAGLWILLWILFLYPTVNNSFTLHYLIFWIAVGICYSKNIRSLSDQYIKEYFQSRDAISKELFF